MELWRSFGNSNNNRGVYSVEFHEDGDKLAVGWRRGYVSLHMAADSYIRVHGLHYTALMEAPGGQHIQLQLNLLEFGITTE